VLAFIRAVGERRRWGRNFRTDVKIELVAARPGDDNNWRNLEWPHDVLALHRHERVEVERTGKVVTYVVLVRQDQDASQEEPMSIYDDNLDRGSAQHGAAPLLRVLRDYERE
jgi:hypothetical protein